jgi:uncharacterized repeat protein (TIGR01451 family)
MNTEKNKNNRITKAVNIGIGFFILLSLVQLPLASSVQAANPRFNIFTPYVHSQTANRDYFLLDVQNSTQGTNFNSFVFANQGDILNFSIFYHNGVGGTVANNTMVRISFPSASASSQTVTAYLWADNADNATQANPMTQSVSILMSQQASLEIISGSVKWFPNQASPLSFNTAPFVFGQTGSELFSSGLNLGGIQGGWEFSGMVNFQARVTNSSGANGLSISKTVRNVTSGQFGFNETVSANQNDLLEFQIQIQNTGNSTLNNVIVRDTMPFMLTYSGGSSRQNGNFVSDGITSGGINIGSLAPGNTATVIFQATITNSSSFSATDTAYVRADQMSERSDTATVFTSASSNTNTNLNLIKYVRNITQGQTGLNTSTNANTGDTIEFSIKITSSAQSINNMRASDNLPSGLNFIPGSVRLDGSFASDSLVSGGLFIGSISSYQTRTITFQATVSSFMTNQTLINYVNISADNLSTQQASCQVVIGQQNFSSSSFQKTVANQTSPSGTNINNEALPGDILQYTLNYTNTSGQTLYNVKMSDTLPSYTTFQDVSNSGSYDSSQNTITWNLGSLGVNSSVSVSYRVKVQTVPSSNFIITNTALFSAPGISDINSNQTQTTVILPTVKGKTVRTVTGSGSLVQNFIYSLLLSVTFLALLYLALKHSDYLRSLKLRYTILKIKILKS